MTQDEANAATAASRTTLDGLAPRAFPVLVVAGCAALAGAMILGLMRGDQLGYFLHSYLFNYCFYLSISLGALFVVAMLHICRAGWGVTLRRLLEILAANMPMLALLLLPILLAALLGNHGLYPWSDSSHVRQDEALREKSLYLNVPFFAARCLAYLAVWWLISRFYLGRSTEQDQSGDAGLTVRMERMSGPALLLLAGTVTLASFDLLMSLDPHWYSTIYGVYFFSGAVVGGLAAVVLTAVLLQATGRLTQSISVEHYHDLGKLLLAFVIFWGYIAFSQYLLIWYGNLPEETTWYLARQTGPWVAVSIGLLFGHLLIPFFGLLPRAVKRNRRVLAFWAAWMLVMHWIDVYWLVMPKVDAQPLPLGAIDLCLAVGLGALWLAGLARVAGERSLVPLKDPRLPEALAFENM